MAYEQPDKGEKFSPRDHPEWVGRLFLVYPTEVNIVQFQDDKGQPSPTDVVTADVAIIDLVDPETGKPKVLKGARIAGRALVPQIKGKVDKRTAALGRLRQLPAQGTKSGAYVLDEFSPADGQLADSFDATDWRGVREQPAPPTGVVSTPTATAVPAPAGAPWFATGDGPQVAAKLLSNGVSNAYQLDEQNARMIYANLP